MSITRRRFVTRSVVAGAVIATTALSYSKVFGANERVNVGVIGFGLIGRIHTRSFMTHADAEVTAVAETYRPRLDAGAEMIGSRAAKHGDFRRMLDDKSIDAVVVATPDHWHALQTMMACAAGKDVYVEKPLTLFVKEGEWMIDVAKRHKSVVQVGVQNRSGPNFQRARDLV